MNESSTDLQRKAKYVSWSNAYCVISPPHDHRHNHIQAKKREYSDDFIAANVFASNNKTERPEQATLSRCNEVIHNSDSVNVNVNLFFFLRIKWAAHLPVYEIHTLLPVWVSPIRSFIARFLIARSFRNKRLFSFKRVVSNATKSNFEKSPTIL